MSSRTAGPCLAHLLIKPEESMVPWQHSAIKGGIILCWWTMCHRMADLDGLIQVDMTLLKWVSLQAASEDGRGWLGWGGVWTSDNDELNQIECTSQADTPIPTTFLYQTSLYLSIDINNSSIGQEEASTSPINFFKIQRLLDQKNVFT